MTENEWDGRLTRELQFVNKLHQKFPAAVVKDCSNIVSDLRKIEPTPDIRPGIYGGTLKGVPLINNMKNYSLGIPIGNFGEIWVDGRNCMLHT